jgi:hypothetical protein
MGRTPHTFACTYLTCYSTVALSAVYLEAPFPQTKLPTPLLDVLSIVLCFGSDLTCAFSSALLKPSAYAAT